MAPEDLGQKHREISARAFLILESFLGRKGISFLPSLVLDVLVQP